MAPKFIYFNKEGEPKMVARVKNEDNVRVAGRGCACGCALPPSSHLHSETAYTPSRQENKDRNLCVGVWVCVRACLSRSVCVCISRSCSLGTTATGEPLATGASSESARGWEGLKRCG